MWTLSQSRPNIDVLRHRAIAWPTYGRPSALNEARDAFMDIYGDLWAIQDSHATIAYSAKLRYRRDTISSTQDEGLEFDIDTWLHQWCNDEMMWPDLG